MAHVIVCKGKTQRAAAAVAAAAAAAAAAAGSSPGYDRLAIDIP